jgi:hypothetical protein
MDIKTFIVWILAILVGLPCLAGIIMFIVFLIFGYTLTIS